MNPPTHNSTCGRDCRGEPQCSERSDVVTGVSVEDRRSRYGKLPIDVPCLQCGSGRGVVCVGCSGPNHYHSVRGSTAINERKLDIVAQIAALNLKLDKLCHVYGPLMPGYCDECGGSDCASWDCQAVRMALAHDRESEAHWGPRRAAQTEVES